MQVDDRVRAIFAALAAHNPHPATELLYRNEFELLIAVMLSAQATDVSVNKVTPGLFKVAGDAELMVRLGIDGLKRHIKSIGLYNTKAKNIIKACELLLVEYGGQVPQRREQLEALPGVGRKTANVVLNTAFGHEVIAVDTHILRVACRLGLSASKTPLGVERDLERVIPAEYKRDAHHWLILHGRYVCKARNPKCKDCCISEWCDSKDKVL